MKKIIIMALMAVAILPTHAENTITVDGLTNSEKKEKNDTVHIRYIHRLTEDDARIFERNLQKTVIYVNDQVTTHLIMPENIKLVDISTDKLVGNQCADNIVRLKPKSMLMDNELAGTVTVIGERHIAQFTVYYTTRGDMSRLCWSIFMSRRKCFRVHGKQYGIRAQVNNIYTVGDYFFIDFSLENRSNIKYDIAEIRLKLMDKKELKATNSQTIELTPVYMVNHADHFTKSYRNVIVLKKLTFPEEKKLRLEITEDQISGRVSYLDINYRDILNADSFSPDLLMNLH
jgi:hypothetical protein